MKKARLNAITVCLSPNNSTASSIDNEYTSNALKPFNERTMEDNDDAGNDDSSVAAADADADADDDAADGDEI